MCNSVDVKVLAVYNSLRDHENSLSTLNCVLCSTFQFIIQLLSRRKGGELFPNLSPLKDVADQAGMWQCLPESLCLLSSFLLATTFQHIYSNLQGGNQRNPQ